ncbi:MAG: YitT family protein [Clostridia bacterium]|nr:YitT family protein [Clostridia bacterium]
MKPYDKPAKKALLTALSIVGGNAVLAFCVAAFIIPHNILIGGTTGIGIVLSHVFPGIDVSLLILILNLFLLLLGLLILGKAFAAKTVVSSILYPLLLGVIEKIPGIASLTDNSVLAAVFAGILLGVALGLVMRVGSSTGGMDVVVLILHKWTHLSVAMFVWLSDIVVIGGQALFVPTESTLLGIFVLIFESIVLDQVMVLGKAQIQLLIITKKYEELRETLLDQLEAGVTMFMVETGRLKESQKSIMCVIPQRKLYNATELIHSIDPLAFITVSQVKEVRGRGFTLARDPVLPPEQSADS